MLAVLWPSYINGRRLKFSGFVVQYLNYKPWKFQPSIFIRSWYFNSLHYTQKTMSSSSNWFHDLTWTRISTIMSLTGRQAFRKANELKFSGSIVLVLRSISAKFQPPEANASCFFVVNIIYGHYFKKNLFSNPNSIRYGSIDSLATFQ